MCRRRSCATASSSRRSRKSASAASSTTPASRATRSRACLRMADARASDVDTFAVSRNPRAHLWRKALFAAAQPAAPAWSAIARATSRRRRAARRASPRRPGSTQPCARARTHFVEHHPAHLASALFASPFDEAAVCAIDGFGDFVSTSWGRVAGSRLVTDGPRVLPAFARAAVSRRHAVPRLSEIRRRVQGDGTRAVRRAAFTRTSCVSSSHLHDDGGVRARSLVLPPLVGRRRR